MLVLLPLGLASAQTKAVLKGIATNAVTENLVVPSGKTLTINSGASIIASGGSTVTGFGGSIATLTDITLTGLANGDFLKYNGTAWINRTAANVRTDLGLVVGTNVQAYDADLTTYAGITPSANVQSLLGAADYAAARTLLNTPNLGGANTFTGVQTIQNTINVGGGASASELRFLEPSGSGTNYMALKAQAMTANVTYTLPAADGTNGQVLSTNGTGTLSWATASGGSGSITTGNTLWVDPINGNDGTGTRGRQDLQYLTIDVAKTEANAGDLVTVRPSTTAYDVAENIFSTSANVHLPAGTTVSNADDTPLLTSAGFLTGKGALTYTTAGVNGEIINLASGSLDVEAASLSVSADDAGVVGTAVLQTGGTLRVKAGSVVADNVNDDASGIVYEWRAGTTYLDADVIQTAGLGSNGIWTNVPAGDPGTYNAYITCRELLAPDSQNIAVYGTGTNTTSAIWIKAGIVRAAADAWVFLIQGNANRIYLEAQKCFGAFRIINANTGPMYVRLDKHELMANGEDNWNRVESGTVFFDVKDVDPAGHYGPYWQVSGGVLNLYNASYTGIGGHAVLTGWTVTVNAVPASGQSFFFVHSGTTYDVWYNVDSLGWDGCGAPYGGANTGLEVIIGSGDTNDQIAATTRTVVNGVIACAVSTNVITGSTVPEGLPSDTNTGFGFASVTTRMGAPLIKQTGGTVNLYHCRADVTAGTHAEDYGIHVTGGTMNIYDCNIKAHGNSVDVKQTGGTVNIIGGQGSGTNGNYRTSGTVNFKTPN